VYVAKVQVRLAEERRDLLQQHVEIVKGQIKERRRRTRPGHNASRSDKDGEAVGASPDKEIAARVGEKRKRADGLPTS
jgi:hypothetical protein